MKKLALILSIFIFIIYNILSEEIIYLCKVKNMRLRDQPNLNSRVISLLSKGDKLIFLEKGNKDFINGINGNWIKIKTKDNFIGWCFDGYIININDKEAMDYIVYESNKYFDAIKELKFGNNLEEIQKNLGIPIEIKKENAYSPLVSDYLMGYWYKLKYKGLYIELIKFIDNTQDEITTIEITDKNYIINNKLKIGLTKNKVIELLGNDFTIENNNEYCYYVGNPIIQKGTIRITISNDIVIKIGFYYKVFD